MSPLEGNSGGEILQPISLDQLEKMQTKKKIMDFNTELFIGYHHNPPDNPTIAFLVCVVLYLW